MRRCGLRGFDNRNGRILCLKRFKLQTAAGRALAAANHDHDRPRIPAVRRVSRGRATLADIASACGVSAATVSLALRGNPMVNEATRERVVRESERQGYVRNRGAANLRQQVSSSVALVINDLSNPFFAEFAAGVDEALGAAGYITLLGSTTESVARQDAVIRSLMEHCPAGIILSPAERSEGERLRRALGVHVPVLVFNREVAGGEWDFLVCDNRRGAALAARHLLGLGHRRIAFVGGHADSSSCRERRLGYLDAMRDAGIEPPAGWLVECAPGRVEAAAEGRRLAQAMPEVSAAVCYNDIVALGLVHGLASAGRRVGTDFAVTGFDDIPEAALFEPSLTTVAVDPRGLGRRAAGVILGRIGDPEPGPEREVAPVELVVRASSCAAPAASRPAGLAR